jgi:hypothetical protein
LPTTINQQLNDSELMGDRNDKNIQDLSEEITESFGTGVHDDPRTNAGREAGEYTNTSPELTGGDVDASWQTAAEEGDEAVGGTVATPDQDVTEEIEAAVGLEMDDRSFLRTQDILEDRDDRRWELDPKSSDDYQERRD